MLNDRTNAKDIVGRGFSFPMRISPRGGLMLTSRQTEIAEAILIILMTPQGQRVMRPTFGCRIHELLFAPNNDETLGLAERYVREALMMWEPRAEFTEIQAVVNPEFDNAIEVEIVYRPKDKRDERTLVYPFYLIPEE